MSELTFSLPLLDEAAVAIEQSGEFETRVNAEQLKNLMKMTINEILDSYKSDLIKGVDLSKIDIQIANNQMKLDAPIRVQIPGGPMTIFLQCTMENGGSDKNRLRKTDFKFDWEGNTFGTSKLRTEDAEGKTEMVLDDLNQALLTVLQKQSKNKRVTFGSVGLHLEGNALNLKLTGSKI